MKLVFLLLAVAFSAAAGEYAVLASGARLRIDRHEAEGGTIRLYSGGGLTELPAAAITRFEGDDYTPPKLIPPAAATIPPAVDTAKMVDETARKYGLPVNFLRSVIKAESGFRTDAVSPKGAIGLMQLMPDTARMLGADPTDPAQNLEAGARYLRELLQKYDHGAWHALAAYNAGPGAVDRHKGIPPYRETREYIRRVMDLYQRSAE